MEENVVRPMTVVMVAEDAVEPGFAWRRKDQEYIFDSILWIACNIKRDKLL